MAWLDLFLIQMKTQENDMSHFWLHLMPELSKNNWMLPGSNQESLARHAIYPEPDHINKISAQIYATLEF